MVLSHSSNRHYQWIIDIIVLLSFLFIFYTIWLGSYALFTPDEGRYSEVAREMVATGDYITPRVNGIAFLDKPILYYWLQAFSINLFGLKEWALRAFPALFGILGCLVTYVCGRRLYDRKTGLISAIILAVSPLYFIMAHYANLDLEVAVLISCSLLFFITGVQETTRLRSYFLIFAYIFSALAFLTKGLIGIAFPAMIIGSWMILSGRLKLLKSIHLFLGSILFLAIVIPWYVLVQKENPGFLHYFFVTQQVTRFLSASEFNNKTPVWFYAPIILIGFFPWTIFIFQALTHHIRNIFKASKQYQTELFFLLWFTIIFIFFSIPNSKIISYILPVFPALALLVGRYLSGLWKVAPQKTVRKATIYFVVVNLIIAASLSLIPDDFHPNEILFNISSYLSVIAFTTVSSASIALFFLRKNNLKSLFSLCVIGNLVLLLTILASAPYLTQNSAKPLVSALKQLKNPQEEVFHYFKYYYDVPLYLEQRVAVVANWNEKEIMSKDNWARELWLGKDFQKSDDILLNENDFWKKYESAKRVFVFLNDNYFAQFKARARIYYIIAKQNDIILLSNQPIKLSKNP